MALAVPSLTSRPRKRFEIINVERASVSDAAVRRLAEQLKLRDQAGGRIVHSDRLRIIHEIGMHSLTVYRASGGFRLIDRSRWQVDDGRSRVRYSEEEAIEHAWRHIRSFGLVTRRDARPIKVTHLRVGTAAVDGGRAKVRVIDCGVLFQRLVGGIPVEGPGGKLVAYLDHEGELTGLDSVWRALGERHALVEELRPLDDVARELERHYASHRSDRVEVRELRLGYFELGPNDRQRYLQPAYVAFSRLSTEADERIGRRSVYVTPAATNAVGRFEPLRPRPPAALGPRRRRTQP
jgi:hypothetical protein